MNPRNSFSKRSSIILLFLEFFGAQCAVIAFVFVFVADTKLCAQSNEHKTISKVTETNEVAQPTAIEVDHATPGSTTNPTVTISENVPRQPFFTRWLWLVLISCFLFALSQVELNDQSSRLLRWASKLALRFSAGYWVLYGSLTSPFTYRMPGFTQPFFEAYGRFIDIIVFWAAGNVLHINCPNVGRGASDTTQTYMSVLVCFFLAVVAAVVWSILDRRRTDDRVIRDLLRSYVRYVLAFTMIIYGLSKVGIASNQFEAPNVGQLAKTYGESSPRDLLFVFMGASRTYVIFSGLGEVVGAVLLIWRRTTTLGAMVVFGIMVNVMMLNFCYDFPVKLYSAHLVVMAAFLLLQDQKRLINFLIFNRPTGRVELTPPYTNAKSIWVQRLVKAIMITYIVVVPIGERINLEVRHALTIFPSATKSETHGSPLMNRGFRWINE